MAKNLVDEILPIGGLDRDSDQKYIKKGDYRNLVNGIKVGDANYGVLKPIKGTESIDLSNGTNIGSYSQIKIAGSVYDQANNGIVLFVQTYDGSWHKSIVRYKEDGTKEGLVVDNANLNFDTKIEEAKIFGDLLVWQERGRPAQIINMADAKAGTVTYNSEEKLSLIKKPPLYEIDFAYGTDYNFGGSHVFDKMFQFRQKYIYRDSLPSVYGITSKIAYSNDIFLFKDSAVQKDDTDNFIDIKFNSGDSTVDKIAIAVREGNIGNWFQVVSIDKDNPENVIDPATITPGTDVSDGSSVTYETSLSDNTEYYYRFYNTGGYVSVANEEISKPYEFIPLNSDSITNYMNRVVFGQNEVDYSDVDISGVDFSPNYQALPSPTTQSINSTQNSAAASNVDSTTWTISSTLGFDLSVLPQILYKGSVIRLRAYNLVEWDVYDDTGTFAYSDSQEFPLSTEVDESGEFEVTLNQTVSRDYFGNNILSFITDINSSTNYDSFNYNDNSSNAYYGLLRIFYKKDITVSSGYSVQNVTYTNYENTVNADLIEANLYSTLKRGRYYKGAVQYIDRYGRAGEPNVSSDCEFFIEDTTGTSNDGVVKVDVSGLDNVSIPDWAYYYRFLISYQPQHFVQVPVLYADRYRDDSGEEDGNVALLIGFTVDTLNDSINQQIEEYENQVETLEQQKDELGSDSDKGIPGLQFKQFWQYQIEGKGEKEERRRQQYNEKIKELERKIELKKQELGNSEKKALANLKQYVINDSDRIRIIHSNVGSSTNTLNQVIDLPILDVVDANYELESEQYVEKAGLWLKTIAPNEDNFDMLELDKTGGGQWQNCLIEIYRPSYTNSTNRFYAIGDIYNVSNPGTGTQSHQSISHTITPVNSYLKFQTMYQGSSSDEKGSEISMWIEDSHVTHAFRSDYYNLGRAFIKTDIEKGIEHESLVYTNPYFEGTQINGLSQADYNNVVYLPSENGKIYSLRNQGGILKAIQAHKITSFYNSQNQILGNRQELKSNMGSVHPKSIVQSPRGYIYGFDLYNSTPWRDTGNGVHQ
ncbi:DUF4200 domain-containing protein, partial [Methanohalobium sp.]|uniref:DUF4200 domain-containing protein n=1 Tax=Methanohalobium sp. TaxID=2837493 RepID=UPI0025DE92FB